MGDAAAWAVMRHSDGFISRVCLFDCEAEREAKQKGDFSAVPLYRSPSLTEAERESVLAMACHCDTRCGSEWVKHSAVLRGLLKRTE